MQCPTCGGSGEIAGPLGTSTNTTHDERHCAWKLVSMHGGGMWKCQHDVFVRGRHPNGYCDQGCCR